MTLPPPEKNCKIVSIDVLVWHQGKWVRGYWHYGMKKWFSQVLPFENKTHYRELENVTSWKMIGKGSVESFPQAIGSLKNVF